MAKGITEEHGRCRINYQLDGVRYVKRLSIPYTPTGIKKAQKIRLAIIAEHEKSVAASEFNKPEAPTVLELSQTYLESTSLAPSSRRKARTALNNYWLPFLANRKVTRVSRIMLMNIISKEMSGLSEKYKKDLVGVLHTVLDLATPEFLTFNPAAKIKFKVEKKTIDPFTIEERDALLDALYELEQGGPTYLFYMLRFYAGLRPGEVIALEWGDYDGETLEIWKTATDGELRQTTKNHEQRNVNLHPKLIKVLNNYPTRFTQGRILQSGLNEPYKRYDTFSQKFTAVQAELGIRYRDPYNCRHTCASMMLEAGMQPAYCAQQLGHKLDQFLNKYATLINKKKNDAEHQKWAATE